MKSQFKTKLYSAKAAQALIVDLTNVGLQCYWYIHLKPKRKHVVVPGLRAPIRYIVEVVGQCVVVAQLDTYRKIIGQNIQHTHLGGERQRDIAIGLVQGPCRKLVNEAGVEFILGLKPHQADSLRCIDLNPFFVQNIVVQFVVEPYYICGKKPIGLWSCLTTIIETVVDVLSCYRTYRKRKITVDFFEPVEFDACMYDHRPFAEAIA